MALPYLEDFLLYLHTNNYSNETIYNYELDLKSFDFFLQNEFDDIDFFKTNKRTIEQFKSYLVSRDRKTANNQKSTKRLSGA